MRATRQTSRRPHRSIFATSSHENYTLAIKSALIFHMCMSTVLSVISHICLFAQDRSALADRTPPPPTGVSGQCFFPFFV